MTRAKDNSSLFPSSLTLLVRLCPLSHPLSHPSPLSQTSVPASPSASEAQLEHEVALLRRTVEEREAAAAFAQSELHKAKTAAQWHEDRARILEASFKQVKELNDAKVLRKPSPQP